MSSIEGRSLWGVDEDAEITAAAIAQRFGPQCDRCQQKRHNP
ncbi:MAG TPA: hypothetical protein V6D02_04275 [Candidatus Obscuribacterales bacterium]